MLIGLLGVLRMRCSLLMDPYTTARHLCGAGQPERFRASGLDSGSAIFGLDWPGLIEEPENFDILDVDTAHLSLPLITYNM